MVVELRNSFTNYVLNKRCSCNWVVTHLRITVFYDFYVQTNNPLIKPESDSASSTPLYRHNRTHNPPILSPDPNHHPSDPKYPSLVIKPTEPDSNFSKSKPTISITPKSQLSPQFHNRQPQLYPLTLSA